jgi:mannose-6-phosphate isomerase-like protein (cupin superfamily)
MELEQHTTKWGSWRDLYAIPGARVKELIVAPGTSLSMQKHSQRREFWVVVEGACTVVSRTDESPDTEPAQYVNLHGFYHVPQDQWHKLVNPYHEPCKIIEVQWGPDCREDDIELCPEDQRLRQKQFADYYEKNNTDQT